MGRTIQPIADKSGIWHAVAAMARLKWGLLRGGLRGSAQQKFQVGISVLLSLVFGIAAMFVGAVIGRTSGNSTAILILALPASSIVVGLLSAATGVEATIDARHLATEPLTRGELGIGLLASAVVGPPAILALLAGAGVIVGWWPSTIPSAVVLVLAVLGWWMTLLLLSRTFANVLGAWATGRLRQLAQAMATLAALSAWLVVQFIAHDPASWDEQRLYRLADVARWTPPGQLGVAITSFNDPASAVLHLLAGFSWLPLLVLASIVSTEKLALSSPRPGGDGRVMRAGRDGLRSHLSFLPQGRVGAVAARTIRTKFRTPRQAVNTVTALVVGAGVFLLGPILDGGDVDQRVVMLGGLLHFAVLFDGNNSFGVDGASIWMEIQAGADARILARAKALASMVVMTLPALLLPVGLAVMSGGWVWLPAAWLLGAGSLMSASGVAVATSAMAPVAMPESPNPLASGDTGQGCLAGIMLAIGMAVLGLVSAPVGIAIYFASEHSAGLAALVAISAIGVGVGTLALSLKVATATLAGRESELVQKVTPSR